MIKMEKIFVAIDKMGLATVIVTDDEYPVEVSNVIAREAATIFYKKYTEKDLDGVTKDVEWIFPELDAKIKEYQDPKKADKLKKLEEDLRETTDIMVKNMESILNRGENLEKLMAQSGDLSGASVRLYSTARKANRKCC